MRELFLKTLDLADETGAIRVYDYSILIDEMDVGPYSCESYGIKVAEQGGGLRPAALYAAPYGKNAACYCRSRKRWTDSFSFSA